MQSHGIAIPWLSQLRVVRHGSHRFGDLPRVGQHFLLKVVRVGRGDIIVVHAGHVIVQMIEAEAVHLEKPNAADSIIWLGRRMAYLGRYKDAVRVFSSGSVLFRNDARFFRHRGHRYLTLRCFDDAIRDFERAAELIKGKPDEVEPDGLPNAKNIPTSTLQSNIWYHLGLAYYLKGDFVKALNTF